MKNEKRCNFAGSKEKEKKIALGLLPLATIFEPLLFAALSNSGPTLAGNGKKTGRIPAGWMENIREGADGSPG